MIKIDLLKNHPYAIPTLSNIWYEVLGKIWLPEINIEEIESLSYEELKSDTVITYIALHDKTPVGFCTLQLSEDIRPDLGPWIADLVVDPKHQKQGIGKMLVGAAMIKAKDLGFEKLYLFTFDPSMPEYYERLGWEKIGMDKFKRRPVTVMEVKL
jgi:GNAT superfamily N-acetyltransferase